MQKKIFILCLAICLLFTISSVCASDVNDTTIASQDTMIDVAQSDDLTTSDEISQTDDGEILSAGKDVETTSAQNDLEKLSASSTYSQLRDEIGSGGRIINLAANKYTYDSGDTIEISVDDTIINGNGAIIDMAGSTIKVFHVTGKNVLFQDLSIINAKFDGNGGAIYFTQPGSVMDCNFTDNYASHYGGAVYFASEGNLSNCNFIRNTAYANNGGAVYFASKCNVMNCNFENNTAYEAGAIYLNAGGSKINATFKGNRADQDGGAITAHSNSDTTINGEFRDNHGRHGGAIRFDLVTANLNVNAIFIDNAANNEGSAICFGGECYNVRIGGEFNKNHAYNGGAIYFGDDVYDSNINATFMDNKADVNGGAIRFNDKVSNSNIASTFIHNIANDNGGAIIFFGALSNVGIYGEFNNNYADNGGAIKFNAGISDSNINASFIGNTADNNGEGAANYFGGTITNVGISGNYIKNTGNNVIYIYKAGDGTKIHDSIFLNNEVSHIINVSTGNIPANNNWFGNNATNYNETPVNVGIELDNWLFLDSKLIPEIKPIDKASDIIFLLKTYDSDSGISDYDNTLLTPVILKIIVKKGTIPKDSANLGEAIEFTPTSLGTGSATATIENIKATVEFTIKQNPDLSLETKELDYSENSVITLNYSDTASGKINITLNGKKFNVTLTDIDLNKTISLGNINADEYNVTISYSGDNQFAEDVVVETLKINKMPTEITIAKDTLDIKALDNISAGASLSPAGVGTLNYYSSNITVVIVGNDGIIKALAKGSAIITVIFSGNDNYYSDSKNITVNVGLKDTIVTVDPALNLTVDDTYAINATIIPASVKSITYTSSNESVVTVDGNGTVTAVGGGNAIITVAIGDDIVYAKNSAQVNVTVQKLKTEINADAITTTYNTNKNLVITLKDAKGNALSGIDISVSLDSAKTYSTDKNGQVIINVGKLVPKKYTAKITFNGNNKYIASSANVAVTVKKAKAKLTAKNKKFKKSKKVKKYTITLSSGKTKISNAKVTLKIKGKKAITAKTNKKGKATFKIKKLNKKGTYKSTIKFKGDKYYNKATKKVKIKIK